MSYKCKSICLPFSLLVCSLLIWRPGASQPSFSETEQLLKQNQKALGINFVALVWKDGKIVYQKQFEKDPGDFGAKFQIDLDACSQWLTAALVMTFVDEGKLSLEDRVSKFIPIYSTYMKSYITIRNCLTYTTGIQADAVGPMKVLQKSKYETLEDEVSAFASKREIATNPGTEFFYSHVGPNIAGRVLEVITKKSFERLMADRITRPLKMHLTSFSDPNGGSVNPSGGAISTASDFMNFLAMLMNKGVFEGKRILSEKAVAEMETSQFVQLPIRYVPKGGEDYHFGLGTWIGQDRVICSPNLNGNWPFIDLCRNYAALLFVKTSTSEPKREIYKQFKQSIDKQFAANCP